jgi:hypothetical protein
MRTQARRPPARWSGGSYACLATCSSGLPPKRLAPSQRAKSAISRLPTVKERTLEMGSRQCVTILTSVTGFRDKSEKKERINTEQLFQMLFSQCFPAQKSRTINCDCNMWNKSSLQWTHGEHMKFLQ